MLGCGLAQEDVELLVAKVCGEAGVSAAAFEAPETYGHTFAASLSLDVAAALLWGAEDEMALCKRDPTGHAAAILLRRLT